MFHQGSVDDQTGSWLASNDATAWDVNGTAIVHIPDGGPSVEAPALTHIKSRPRSSAADSLSAAAVGANQSVRHGVFEARHRHRTMCLDDECGADSTDRLHGYEAGHLAAGDRRRGMANRRYSPADSSHVHNPPQAPFHASRSSSAFFPPRESLVARPPSAFALEFPSLRQRYSTSTMLGRVPSQGVFLASRSRTSTARSVAPSKEPADAGALSRSLFERRPEWPDDLRSSLGRNDRPDRDLDWDDAGESAQVHPLPLTPHVPESPVATWPYATLLEVLGTSTDTMLLEMCGLEIARRAERDALRHHASRKEQRATGDDRDDNSQVAVVAKVHLIVFAAVFGYPSPPPHYYLPSPITWW